MKDYLQSLLFQQITREEAEKMLLCSKAQFRDYRAGSIIFGGDRQATVFVPFARRKSTDCQASAFRETQPFVSGKRDGGIWRNIFQYEGGILLV